MHLLVRYTDVIVTFRSCVFPRKVLDFVYVTESNAVYEL